MAISNVFKNVDDMIKSNPLISKLMNEILEDLNPIESPEKVIKIKWIFATLSFQVGFVRIEVFKKKDSN